MSIRLPLANQPIAQAKVKYDLFHPLPLNSTSDSLIIEIMTSSSNNNKSERQSLSAKEQVMLQFHRTTLEMTRNFLETQKQVMLAYLNGSAEYEASSSFSIPETLVPGRENFTGQTPIALKPYEPVIASQPLAPAPGGRNGNGHQHSLSMQQAADIEPTRSLATPAEPIISQPLLKESGEKRNGKDPHAQNLELNAEELVNSLVEIVSDRTGYPADMLDPTLDLESDLGIDSIKRVEILNTFRKLLPEERQQALESSIEQLAGIKTLDGIFKWIRTELTAPLPAPGESAAKVESDAAGTREIVATGTRISGARVTSPGNGEATFTFTMDTKEDLYLKDHTFDGIPVMPMAVSVELMVEAARSMYPEWKVTGLRNLEIPAGIVFESRSKEISVEVSTQEHTAGLISLNARVNSRGAIPRTHFKCIVDMAPKSLPPVDLPVELPHTYADRSFKNALSALPGPQEIYSTMMFHGDAFQGIREVRALGENGITGSIASTPVDRLLASRPKEKWIIDPIVLDSAMQLAGVWARKFLDITVLPAGVESLTLFAPMTDEQYSVIVAIPPETKGLSLKCSLAVYSSKGGRIVLLLEGLKGIGSKSLNRLSSQQA